MNGIILVAPAEASWATRAEAELHAARLLVARLYEPALLPLLVGSGGVAAIAIDVGIAGAALRSLRGCLPSETSVKLMLVHDGPGAVTVGRLHSAAWPATIDEVRELLASA